MGPGDHNAGGGGGNFAMDWHPIQGRPDGPPGSHADFF